ncbi:hypothetical protein [Adhaeribacter soli]|uniref:DUF4292 domain-containing protein n=1 Tax=Adhaeribacter soli TaxID=2607655 RepID=A0A5N1IUM3_9BACT|nr:hypothetical protein [Adhaeribacter soli]KAA9331750.1 hypothetical protein F0P94_13140 [Adhaeribacter soli]
MLLFPMKKVLLASLLFAALFAGCTPVKIALNDSQWPEKKEYAVTNKKPLFKQQQLAFGDFQTREVKRSWTKGTQGLSGVFIGDSGVGFNHITKKQKFHFKLQGDQNQTSEVNCATNIRIKDLVIGNPNSGLNTMLDFLSIGIDTDNQFYAQILAAPETQPWQLILDNRAIQISRNYAGSLMQSPENYYTIVPVNKVQGKNGPVAFPIGSVGYEIRNKQNEPVAAVSLIDRGTVYLKEVPPAEKFLLANACAALLLQARDL